MNNLDLVNNSNLFDHVSTQPVKTGKRDKLPSMIISQPQRAGIGYRLRDMVLRAFTICLWCLPFLQAYVIISSANIVPHQAVIKALTLLAIDFFIVFTVIYVWSNYERLKASWYRSRQSKRPAARALPHLAPDPELWHGKWQEKWHAQLQTQMYKVQAAKNPPAKSRRILEVQTAKNPPAKSRRILG